MIRFSTEILALLLVILPSSFIIYQTTKEHIVISTRLYAAVSVFFAAVCIPFLSLFIRDFGFTDSRALIPVFLLAFPLFYQSIDMPFWRTLVIFLWACILLTFPLNFTYIFNAFIKNNNDVTHLAPVALVFQIFFDIFLCIGLYYRINKLDKTLFNESRTPENIWFSWLSIPFMFFSLIIAIIPADFTSLSGSGTGYAIELLITLCLFLLYLYLTVIYIAFLMEYTHAKEYEEGQRLLDIQTLQYRNLQKQMDLDKKARHDYKHSLRLLFTLAQNEKWEELKSYIAEFAQASDEYIIKNYSSIPAINAMLNYYMMRAQEASIPALLQVDLPDEDELAIPIPEFCSMIGNIMENAIDGCMTLPVEERKFSISITLKNEINLYIVSTNTFDESSIKSELNADSIINFPSTKHKKSGIGLRSIKETADKYNGTLRLRQENGVFFLDVAMILN